MLPLAYLPVRAFDQGWEGVRATLWRSRTAVLLWRSLELAAIVTGLSLIVGVGLALLVVRTDLPLRRTWQVALALPLALPSYVAAWSWIALAPGLSGRTGAVLVLTSISYPFVYLPVLAALRRCDPALEDVARGLGHRPLGVLARVVLPQIRPAAAGGGLLVALYVLSDFGAVATMRHEVLTHVIYRSYRSSFDRTPPAVLGCVLALLALAIVALESRSRRHVAKVGAGALRAQKVIALRGPGLAVTLFPAAVLAIALGVPAWGTAVWMRRGTSRADSGQLIDALGNSLLVGALGAVLIVGLAFPLVVLAQRHPGRLSRAGIGAVYAGHALPGVVVGLALVFFGVRYAPSLYQELPMLLLAYVALFLSLGVAALQASMAQIPSGLEDVARSLGRSRWGAWRDVTLRLAAPGAAAAATLAFLTIGKELPATLFLRPTGFDTLATRLWGHTSIAAYAAAAPYAIAIVLFAAVPAALLGLAMGRDRP